jgi:hypothetical protein
MDNIEQIIREEVKKVLWFLDKPTENHFSIR